MTPRQWFAEEIDAVCGLRTRALVAAFAVVPRERFLYPGPWLIQGEGEPRLTPDADPRHVYHNVSIALDASRRLYNGTPAVLARWLDALELHAGGRVLHVGCGTGYYSAIAAQVVGPEGLVDAVEADEGLAAHAAETCGEWPRLRVHQGLGRGFAGPYDGILINAGVTHPEPDWLDALAPHGRLVIPFTVAMPPGAPVGKGIALCVTRDDTGYGARPLMMTMIYNAVGLRDPARVAQLGSALGRGDWSRIVRLRRDNHPQDHTCWLHGDEFCFSTTPHLR